MLLSTGFATKTKPKRKAPDPGPTSEDLDFVVDDDEVEYVSGDDDDDDIEEVLANSPPRKKSIYASNSAVLLEDTPPQYNLNKKHIKAKAVPAKVSLDLTSHH